MTYCNLKAAFCLSGGTAILALITAPAFSDIVQADDVIVDGSLCVGFDCASGENFGYDTIRMKENNTRIAFIDTSSAGSFATNNWQLTANSAANGGGDYFAIDDTTSSRTPFLVEAGAPTNALYVDDGGRVGFGTSSPYVELHVVEGDSPTLRLEQDGSSGFTAHTWDIAGNETNFFIRDVTNSSALPFRIEPGADTNSIYIDDDNDIGFGLTNPSYPLHIRRSTGDLKDMITMENNGDVAMIFSNTAAGAATPEWKFASFNGDFFIGTPTTRGAEFLLSNTGNLTITGSFISNGTTLNVPDYVFEDDYDLLSLTEVQDFIDTNGHLPRIPSAGEINAGGINVSEMQMALLEKIEELTLYTLEQQARIAALEAKASAPVQD